MLIVRTCVWGSAGRGPTNHCGQGPQSFLIRACLQSVTVVGGVHIGAFFHFKQDLKHYSEFMWQFSVLVCIVLL